MECEKDLSRAKKQEIESSHIGMDNTLKVFCKAEIQYVEKLGKCLIIIGLSNCQFYNNCSDANLAQQNFDIIETIEDKPGALLSVLRVIYSIEVR